MRYQSDRPRAHHHHFGHRLLPALVLRGQADLYQLASRALLDQLLLAWWQDVGERLSPADRMPADGLHAEVASLRGAPVVVVFMPAATHAAEAHLLVVMPGAEPRTSRCFVLEHSWALDDQPATVLAEWTANGHINFGPGPAPSAEAFLQ